MFSKLFNDKNLVEPVSKVIRSRESQEECVTSSSMGTTKLVQSMIFIA